MFASQLAHVDHRYRRALCNKIEDIRSVAEAGRESQFNMLIRDLCTAGQLDGDGERCQLEDYLKRPILIILDDIDVYSPEREVTDILYRLLQFDMARLMGRKLRILITSRPEPHIRTAFRGRNCCKKIVLHEVDDVMARNDIQTYLKLEIAELTSQGGSRNMVLPMDWPPPEQFDKLLNHCGSFFACAAAAVRFIRGDPVGKLPSSWIWLSVTMIGCTLINSTFFIGLFFAKLRLRRKSTHTTCRRMHLGLGLDPGL